MGRATSLRGQRFLRILRSRATDAERPLPVQLKPFAQLIVGPAAAAAVRIRTGPATRSALAEAERPAATVGRVIHMESPPDSSPRRMEVLAHELVHAARPATAARFFDDDHQDGEERLAAATGGRVAALIRAFEGRTEAGESRHGRRPRRNPDLAWGTEGLAVGAGASPLTAGAIGQLMGAPAGARGRPGPTGGLSAPPAVTGSPAGGPTAGAGADAGGRDGTGVHRGRRGPGRHRPGDVPGSAGLAGTASGTGLTPEFLAELPPAVARLISGSGSPPSGPITDGGPPVPAGPQMSRTTSYTGAAMPSSSAAGATNPPFVQSSSNPVTAEMLDWIVEAVEERILAELERRGMRFQPGVF